MLLSTNLISLILLLKNLILSFIGGRTGHSSVYDGFYRFHPSNPRLRMSTSMQLRRIQSQSQLLSQTFISNHRTGVDAGHTFCYLCFGNKLARFTNKTNIHFLVKPARFFLSNGQIYKTLQKIEPRMRKRRNTSTSSSTTAPWSSRRGWRPSSTTWEGSCRRPEETWASGWASPFSLSSLLVSTGSDQHWLISMKNWNRHFQ